MPTLTFLFADQVGSTEQLRKLGDVEARAIRAALVGALQRAVVDQGGRVVDLTGDGVFAAFDGAAEALTAAQTMQGAVQLANRARAEEARTTIRVGVHTGEPVLRDDGGYFGLAVVVARRLCDDADEGTVHVSGLTRSIVASHGTFTFGHVGARPLKGIDEPVDTWTLAYPDLLQTLAPVPDVVVTDPGRDVGALVTRTVAHPEAFVELADHWHRTTTDRTPVLVAVSGPDTATAETVSELRRRIATDHGLDLSDALAPPKGSAASEGIRAAIDRHLASRLPAPARTLVVHPESGSDPAAEGVLRALGEIGPCALTVVGAAARELSADDVAWLIELGHLPGWLVAVTTNDEGRLASSPIAALLAESDAFVRVGSVAGSATEQHDGSPLPTVFVAGQLPPAPASAAGAEATTVRHAATLSARVVLPDGSVVPIPDDGVVIGRGREASFRIDDPDVSRRHIRILPTGGTWLLEDLGSTNGTQLNGAHTREHRLSDGDEITIGSSTLTFSLTVLPPS